MIALSLALAFIGALAALVGLTHVGATREARHQDHQRALLSLEMERARLEATKPVPPHEELVAKVAELERRVGGIESWAKR